MTYSIVLGVLLAIPISMIVIGKLDTVLRGLYYVLRRLTIAYIIIAVGTTMATIRRDH